MPLEIYSNPHHHEFMIHKSHTNSGIIENPQLDNNNKFQFQTFIEILHEASINFEQWLGSTQIWWTPKAIFKQTSSNLSWLCLHRATQLLISKGTKASLTHGGSVTHVRISN